MNYVPPHEAAEIALRLVREARELTYDTETSGLDWKRHSVVGYVLGDLRAAPDAIGSGVYVPIRHGGGGNLMGIRPLQTPEDRTEISEFERELAKAFEDRNRVGRGPVVGHHMKFDVHMSANHGVMLGRNLRCTQDLAAMLDEYSHSFSLDAVSEKMGVVAKKGEALYQHMANTLGGKPDRSIMEHFWRMPGNDPLVYEYSVGDAHSTSAVYLKQIAEIEKQEMSFIADVEGRLIWTVFRMERRGIKVDLDRLDELRYATERQIERLLADFPVGFNTRAPSQVKAVLEEAGFTDWPTTEKGNPSFTEKWLKKNKVGKGIIAIRQLSNLLNSFVGPMKERHVFEGRVHATLNQLKSDDKGTISGRFSCSEPNLQQVPKRNKEIAAPYRRLFVADEGYVFWERDYSQCEPRLFAHYSQDPTLLAGYNAEPFVDVHDSTAALLNVERDPTAKRMNMGIFTGMQPRTFSDHMGWSLEEATRKFHAWFAAYPSIRQFQDKAKARLANRGYVHTLLGRRCRLEHKRFAYRGTSKIIQGSNADILKYKLLEADQACEETGDIVQVLMTVHDSFNGQFQNTPEGRALFEEITAQMASVQGEPFNLTVPFVMDGHEGGDWCEATYGVKK